MEITMSDSSSVNSIIGAIFSAFGGDEPTTANEIPKRKILEWMRSPDLQVRGCIYAMIVDDKRGNLIKPALEFDDYYGFVVPYLEQCIEENPDLEWVESRYLAGHALVVWIVSFWNNKAVPRKKIAEIKERIGALYKHGDEGVRDAVVNGVLEHLFEHRPLVKYFKDWQEDPVLATAYSDALLWAKKKSSSASP